jgi:nucleotide-binding universal stress UspA family protein
MKTSCNTAPNKLQTIANPIQSAAKCAAECQTSASPPQLSNILIAVDFSKYSEAALQYGTFLAERFGATLTLVHAVEPYIYPEDLSAGFTIEDLDARWLKDKKDKMETLRRTIKPGVSSTIVVTMGTAWNRIVGVAKSRRADLIIVGTHGRTGIKHALMGSTAERVVRHATCPVLVVHLPANDQEASVDRAA